MSAFGVEAKKRNEQMWKNNLNTENFTFKKIVFKKNINYIVFKKNQYL